jgi:hypothetical protein
LKLLNRFLEPLDLALFLLGLSAGCLSSLLGCFETFLQVSTLINVSIKSLPGSLARTFSLFQFVDLLRILTVVSFGLPLSMLVNLRLISFDRFVLAVDFQTNLTLSSLTHFSQNTVSGETDVHTMTP